VRPLLAAVRVEMGLAPNPLAAYQASGYYEKVCAERQAANGGGEGGYLGA
jgi:L-rhamnose isomerase/sugar isomerase